MKCRRFLLTIAALAAGLLPVVVVAQNDPSEGRISGNYRINQTLEMGWQTTDQNGNGQTYKNFVNLDDGFRVFEQTLQMRSLNHQGTLFDSFYAGSFGWGGDPNQVTRLRISKNKWYNFNGSFRRDYNEWDYNLIGNPLNPPNVPGTPNTTYFPANTSVAYSPHQFSTVRRMTDLSLTLLPQARFRPRLGYSRTTSEGPTLGSFHEGTDIALFQRTRWVQDSYQIGFDFRPAARTVISYDQFFQNYKQDPRISDATLGSTPFGNLNVGSTGYVIQGTQIPFDAGLPFDPYSSRPCAQPIRVAATSSTPAQIDPACNGYQFYGGFSGSNLPTTLQSSLSTVPRTLPETFWTPTEKISLQSNYWKDVDVVGRFSYSKSEVNWLWNELGIGYISRTAERQFAFGGPGRGSRFVVNGDFSVTWRITDHLNISDSFLYNNLRLPSFWNSTDNALFGTSNLFAPVSLDTVAASCVMSSANNSTICPPHARPSGGSATSPLGSGSSSGADVGSELLAGYLDQSIKSNTIKLGFDVNRRLGGHVGYRFTDRQISDRSFLTSQAVYYPGYSGTLPGPGSGATWTQLSSTFNPANPTWNRWYNNAARGDCVAVAGPTAGTWVLPADCTLQSNGSIIFDNRATPVTDSGWLPIHEHGGLAGVFLRPVDELRINFDAEFTTASSVCPVGNAECAVGQATVTRISPEHLQHYNLRAKYTPRSWFSLNGSVNIIETRNNSGLANFLGHNRNYGFGATISRSDRWALDFGYDYNDGFSAVDDCFVATVGSPAVRVVPGTTCPAALGGSSYQLTRSNYLDNTHSGYFNVMFKPQRRVTLNAGYDIVKVDGSGLLTGAYRTSSTAPIVPLSVLGPQVYTYHRPSAGIAVAVNKEVTLKTNWRYYDYNEPSGSGPTWSRNFYSHVMDFSLRYAF